MVDVSSQNNSVSINVSSIGNSASIKATPDTALYYSEKSREYATSDKLIDGKDYSSKYYANKAKESASNAQGFESAIRDVYNGFLGETTEAIENVQGARDEAIANIETSRVDAIDSINSTKTTILNDIEFVAEGEKQEIGDLIDNGKDELKEAIGDVKVLTTLEIGDIGFTQMAIDETLGKRRKLNGQVIVQDQYVQFTNIVKNSVALNPDLACTEAEWQTELTMSANGVCYKYVIDDEAGTIRLPKYPDYLDLSINGAKTVSVYGNGKTLGLSDGTNNRGMFIASNSNINSHNTVGTAIGSTASASGLSAKVVGVTTDAKKSGLTGKVTTSSEKIKGTYFIQVATGAETEDNIVNEIELNNPFSLLDYKYSEYELNNLSWLRSEGQYNAKAIYPAVYDLLLKIYNGTETKAGVSVKLTTETFTDYDFVLNTADETFRLPLLDGSEDLPQEKLVGLTLQPSPMTYQAPFNGWIRIGAKSTANYGYVQIYNERSTGVISQAPTTNARVDASLFVSKGDFVNVIYANATVDAFNIIPAKGNGSLYFYVGETVQNANLINAGRIEEKIASLGGKVASLIPDNKSLIGSYAMPSNKVVNLTLGASGSTYTAPANGWLQCACTGTAGSTYFEIVTHYASATASFTGGWGRASIPIKKGTVATVYYGGNNFTSQLFRFTYAEGDR